MKEQGLTELYEKSNSDIAGEIGRRFKSRRLALRLTQKEVAEQSGVSVMTLVRFERGEAGSIQLNNFIALLRTIQQLESVDEILPEIPESLYNSGDMRRRRKQLQRIRKTKDEG